MFVGKISHTGKIRPQDRADLDGGCIKQTAIYGEKQTTPHECASQMMSDLLSRFRGFDDWFRQNEMK